MHKAHLNELEQRLVKLLHSVAAYNDKGFIWMNHSPNVIEEHRTRWRAEANDLIRQIGVKQFSPELIAELAAPDVMRDDSGDYAYKVEAWFSRKRS